ncbi:PREDICTED: uncharacterized protein LOC106110150 [Papilio polytes]|uniref:uncharacterized protein LOC106110150 n=1 Tax=Papilio polytes TaxID=76194 RepID=UPI000675F39C|nr:PREDICTED: uncharacterized protein LOC106110150 [Papilio polytes]XP_013147322.1 PREDICTED: uncharacterized protein LOC106110150 [Papilio polytes]XP_013147323.1 PREDICTED: uncharacterized protein LOC106110150 [Papilio polytes]
MSHLPQQGFVPEKIQEYNLRANADAADSPPHQKIRNAQDGTHKKEPSQNGTDKPPAATDKARIEEKTRGDAGVPARLDNKNPFSPNYYRHRQQTGHFEMGPRGLDYSPHRMGAEFAGRVREFGPQRLTSIHGHELTEGPGPEPLMQRAHFGSQATEAVFRQEYFGPAGASPPRASRFSSQEYLAAPGGARWPDPRADPRAEYRQRRRSQQDLHSLGHSPESGILCPRDVTQPMAHVFLQKSFTEM